MFVLLYSFYAEIAEGKTFKSGKAHPHGSISTHSSWYRLLGARDL